jgi:AraC-like DNA-binding protein
LNGTMSTFEPWNKLRKPVISTVAYLSRLFQRFGHTTPYRFLMRLKMNRATELLVDDGMLVKEVAAKLEFADAFHFSRVFKRVYGLPPGRFIKYSK